MVIVCIFIGAGALACGFFAGLSVGYVMERRLKRQAAKGSGAPRKLGEDEMIELRRRQREIQNFLGYIGDEMPKVQE